MIRKKIVMATNNAHKVNEIRAILPQEYELLCLADIGCHDDIPETAETLEGNALIKARYVRDKYHLDCFADDTGLEVEALNGAPGVHTARYAGDGHDTEANIDKLLRELQGKENRKARFRTAIALIEGDKEYVFEGIVDGYIATSRLGEDGFGYDPVFSPEETHLTFAQLGVDVKNRISHRARAVAKLVEHLNKSHS